MIAGYSVGTEVKWNTKNTLTTGIVEQVFRSPRIVEIEGRTIRVSVTENSPTYLIREHDGGIVVLSHRDVFLKEMNEHT